MRMSSGASVAYEKPRSGRSTCIEETPRSNRIASACTPFAASCASTSENSPRRKRPCAPVRFRTESKYGAHRRVAVDRDQLAAAAQIGREQLRVAAGAEGGVDDGLARLHGERLPHLVGEDRDVVSRVGTQDVRQHPPHSLREP